VTLDDRVYSSIDLDNGVNEEEAKSIAVSALAMAGYYASDNWKNARVVPRRDYDFLERLDPDASSALKDSYAVEVHVTGYGTPQYVEVKPGVFVIREPSAVGVPSNKFFVYVDRASGLVKRMVFASRLRAIVEYKDVYVENCIGIQAATSP